MTHIIQNQIPQGYFSETTMCHLRPQFASTSRWLLRSAKAMLACKLTLVYAQYHQMSDLQSLVASDYEESYEHAELMAAFFNQLLPSRPTSPSELMCSKEEYADEAIDRYKEYKHYLELFSGECFIPEVAEQFCKMVYEADDYYTFKAFSSMNYSVYAEALLLFQIGKIDYLTFVDMFQKISLFEGRRKPLNAADLKLYLKTMHKITDLYISLLQEYLNKKQQQEQYTMKTTEDTTCYDFRGMANVKKQPP